MSDGILPTPPRGERTVMLTALTKAISWNDSLIDAYENCNSTKDKQFKRALKAENNDFKRLHRYIAWKGTWKA